MVKKDKRKMKDMRIAYVSDLDAWALVDRNGTSIVYWLPKPKTAAESRNPVPAPTPADSKRKVKIVAPGQKLNLKDVTTCAKPIMSKMNNFF